MIFRDVKIGEKFSFNGKAFVKLNNLGEAFGFLNCRELVSDMEYHLHPTATVSYLN